MHHIIYDFFGLNKAIFTFTNNITNVSVLPNILKGISEIFFIGNFPVYYFVLCLYCYWRLKKERHPEQSEGSRALLVSSKEKSGSLRSQELAQDDGYAPFTPIYNELVKVGMCYALFGFTYAALKFGINLPRPFCSLPHADFVTILDTTHERCLSSFPSAHTGLSIIIAYYLWPILKNYQKIITVLAVALVAISRVTLAMHYPADILYSIFIAFILIFVSNRLFELLRPKLINPIGRVIFRLLF